VLQIAAALPGGDPLAAAIAAGETPSPEMVAAATGQPLTSVVRLWAMVAALVAGLVIFGFFVQNTSLLGLAPLAKSPEEMAEHARELLHHLGYPAPPVDTAYWYEANSTYLHYRASHGSAPEIARQLRSAAPAPMRFIYRQSPQPLLAPTRLGYLDVTLTQPPDNKPGMITMVLDGAGRLLSFSAVPPLLETEGTAASPPYWGLLFAEAGLNEKTLTPVAPRWVPPIRFDRHVAWDCVLSGEPVHIIAAAYRDTAVYFRVVGPWMPDGLADSAPAPAMSGIPNLIYQSFGILLMIGALLLARRNVRLGRGDRKGAARIAITLLIASLVDWLFLARHATDAAEFYNYQMGVAVGLYGAAYVYLAYLAVEPYVRRRWPGMLISWTRLLAGRFSDPRVGRDLLAGILAGLFQCIIVVSITTALTTWFNVLGQPPSYPLGHEYAIRGWVGAIGMVASCLLYALIYALSGVVELLLARFVARRLWLTIVLWMIINGAGVVSILGMNLIIAIPAALAISTVSIFVLFRFGILGATTAQFINLLIPYCLLTVDPSRWYFESSTVVLVVLAVLVVHGFRAALAGRPIFGRAILED
jgi:serine/threonine-protein kinase